VAAAGRGRVKLGGFARGLPLGDELSNFDLPLRKALILNTGRVLATLRDVVVFIGELPEFPHLPTEWEAACDAIGRAAKTADQIDIEVATAEIAVALVRDGMLDIGDST
jgi:hypothetical protein